MIRKTMTITSIAILVAAISVATTMTMVQADSTNDFVDINIPTADLPNSNVQIGGGVEYTSFIGDGGHPITVDIDGGAGTLLIDLTSGPSIGADDPIVVTISDIQWRDNGDLVTGAIGSFSCSLDDGATATPVFNKDTLKVTITGGVHNTPIDINCEFVAFHGEITKAIVDDCILEVKKSTPQECTFRIDYEGARATIVDTVSAGWEEVIDFDGDGDACSVDEPKGKNKKNNNKSATGFTCPDVGTDVEIDVTITTRQSPGGGHKLTVFKPTSCNEPFDINSGAKALLTDDGGLVLGTLDGKPLVLDSTGFLSADDVVDNISANPDILCSEA